MRVKSIVWGTLVPVFAGMMLTSSAGAAEIRVMISGTFLAAYQDLVPEFERTTSNTVVTSSGSSTGRARNTIQSRLERGEPVDAFIMVGEALDELVKQGKVVADSRVDLARSGIGMAVRAGAPKPDISSVETFKRALLDAKSIAYSESASGVYLSTELFQRLGIADQMKVKGKKIQGQPVGLAVARGEAEIALHQISELLPIPGIDYVGPLPAEIQRVTVIAAGIAVGAKEADAARALIKFLASPAAAPAIMKSALEPMTP
ncbi:MAG: extracellular solute-binding protein [Alphaproteobacteria bacterium]